MVTPFFKIMILLELDTRNDNVALTLQEKTTLNPVYYLFEVTNSQDQAKQYFTATDSSDYKTSYNKFSLKAISSGTPDDELGEFLSNLTDQWEYKVYEQSDADNRDPSGLTEVESGILRVDRPRPAVVEYEQEREIVIYAS